MDKQKYYESLASKWIDGTISDEEKEVFSKWFSEIPDQDIVLHPSYAESEEQLKLRIFNQVKARLGKPHMETKATISSFAAWRNIAAAITVIFASTLLIYFYKTDTENDSFATIVPGGSRATLVLSDGKEVLLDSINVGAKVYDGNVMIQKDENGHLTYSFVNDEGSELVYNTINTPAGGEYRVTLPDGSKVWLNSLSSFKYPLKFAGNRREVILHYGEAYFEVAKHTDDKTRIPFRVYTDNQMVDVLGTQFNINTYDSKKIKTSLVEGSIIVGVKSSSNSYPLSPGQQAQLNRKNGAISLESVNLDGIVAWKEGYFYFQDASLPTILEEFSRWYDIKVEYKNSVQEYQFMGKIPRSTELETAMEVLKTTGVNFEIKDKKLIVY